MSKLLSRLSFVGLVAALAAAPLASLSAAPLAPVSIGTAHPSSSGAGALGFSLAAAGAVGMAIRIKDTASIAKKFVSRAQQAGGDYKDGVTAAGPDWETNTKNSEPNWKLGVTQAASDGRFGKGVSAAGSAKYVKRAADLGAQRYPVGVGASMDDYARGVAPHLDAMKNLELPPRGPKGDPSNMRRAQVVAERNRAIRLGK